MDDAPLMELWPNEAAAARASVFLISIPVEVQMSNRASVPKISAWSEKIRILSRRDLPLVTEHFLRLDLAARRERFGRGISDADIVAYTERLPIERGVLAGCFPDDTLRGLIEARPVAGESCHWECVVSIEPEWRRKGLGLTLTDKAFEKARKAGASRVYMRCSTANTAGQHFLARFTRTLREDDGDAVAAVDLTDPAMAAAALASLRAPRRHA
jgi:GNAT superfamily N-acetyltransferase